MAEKIKDDISWLKCQVCEKVWSSLNEGLCPICWTRKNIETLLPEKFKQATFENYKDYDRETNNLKTSALNFLTSNRGLYLAGSVGCGKTHLSIATFRELVNTNYKQYFVYMTSTPELMIRLRECFKPHAQETEESILGRLSRVEYLILDDFGAEKTTDYSVESLFTIIDRRYQANLNKIFITSNLSIKELADKTSDRIASRIVDMCDITWADAQDYRLKQGE